MLVWLGDVQISSRCSIGVAALNRKKKAASSRLRAGFYSLGHIRCSCWAGQLAATPDVYRPYCTDSRGGDVPPKPMPNLRG